ncbi:unnamed protein product [Cylindrotheca closterium]|uniref:Uncharacterized protein n=1 Tax=Cylindrotheca closterium TaxID=2856 RepID=A0AAD2G8I3_9STRA|nr:unnamed protein product [Cylindrotheca closterium]
MIPLLIAAAAAVEEETASEIPHDDPTSNWTAVLLAIVSLIFYWVFLKPTAQDTGAPPPTVAENNSRRVRSAPQQQRRPAAPAPAPQVMADRRLPTPQNLSDNALEVLLDCQSKPSFVTSTQDKLGLGGHKALVDGLVAFGHTEAAVTTLDASSRTERAKVLSRLGSSPGMTLSAPPSKGSTMVVSLPFLTPADSSISKLQHILQVLGSYYNLIVIGSIDPSKPAPASLKEQQEQQDSLQNILHAGDLKESILPSHRILLASSKVGRIALVRQLVKVELMVDYQPEVQAELGRFGYKVAIVPQLGSLLDD